ncbi:hypothetical protein F5876DRAFT_43583 [Lentinula aff. lateritia]|uniref:Uncharacterized protein n=1 Tax=Lentinula aff. lateritia TaxID=2804960 RepID=A0ACC1TYD8_9AGAR|nr:hypothetical protein F5876DRAFT_43583 [Lentinula aff. lateritia]
MIIVIPLLLALAVSTLAANVHRRPPRAEHVLRQENNPDPIVGGSPNGGWQSMPQVKDATAYPNWTLNDSGAMLPVYQTTGLIQNEVTRAVIVLPGEPRDCWYYWNAMNNALYLANYQNSSISRSQISIMAPCFWTQVDVEAGAAQPDVLIWGTTTWISGHANVGPTGVSDYSSFKALDALIEHYMHKSVYPNLKNVVLAGHSAGGQTVQRYAGLRQTTENDDRLHFWVANPGSLMWLSADRPHPNTSCSGIDEYKYGLAGDFPAYGSKLDRDSILSLYNSRIVNYAWGTADNGNGDTRCEAETQGSTHYTRGQNFVNMVNTTFGWPANATVDWVEGVSHDNVGMMESAEGIDKVSCILPIMRR